MSDKYVLICQNADCKARQAGELLEALDKRLKDFEVENDRLRRAVSDLTLDKLILQESTRRNS